MERKRFGFTIMELLTVLAVIAMLVGLLIPALSMVRNIAKKTQQKAQLTTIELALMAFKGDYGDYPPSDWLLPPDSRYPCGAQKLAEALLGWDLMGFHPKSDFTSDGRSKDDTKEIYPDPLDSSNPAHIENLKERRGRYLELTSANAFKLRDLFGAGQTVPLEEDTFVICDVFGAKKIILAAGQTVKAGTPILYYRADTSSKTIDPTVAPDVSDRIYNVEDNLGLLGLGRITDSTKSHRLVVPTLENFYRFDYEGGIRDPKVTAVPWPHRPDSYILISAGADGEYGTRDDITNF